MSHLFTLKKLLLRALLISFISIASLGHLSSQTFTELVIPKYMGAKTAASANNTRTPVAFCFQIDGLAPNTSYDVQAQLGLITDAATSFGAGNIWSGTAFSGSKVTNAFLTNASGSSGPVWVFIQPTGNATRFGGGAIHNLRVGYTVNGGTIPSVPAFISAKTITSLDIATTPLTAATTDDGAFIAGSALPVSGGKYVLIFDNVDGTGDPLFAYQIRQAAATNSSQSDFPTAINDIYTQAGTSAVGNYPAIIPIGANNPNGVRRIESRNADNTVFAYNTDDDGIWPSGANTTTLAQREVVTITSDDAPLQPTIVDITPPTFTVTPHNNDIDVAVDVPIILTFDEAIRNIDDSEITDANVASLLTLKETDASGADIAFTATIDADKKIITVTPDANLANSQVYYAAIAPVEDASNNATTESSMTFTTIAATTAVISDVAITETAPYYAGDNVTITWTSSNVTDVKIEAWVPSENSWNELFGSTPSDGSESFTIPADAMYSTDYKLRITDLNDASVTAESSTFTIIAVVDNLLDLRAQPENAIVKYTGIATVTFAQASRNQKYIQDATAAVLIDDPNPGFIGAYNVGDGITNIEGKILLYHTLIEFTPQATTGEHTTGIEIVPEVRTLESLTTADQCKLVKIEDFAFKTPTQFDANGLFVKSKNYDLDGQDNTVMAYRTAFTAADYIGGKVPVGPISSICIVGQFDAQMQITSRWWSDMTIPATAEFEGTPNFVLTGESVQFTDLSTNATSWEWTFDGGTPATSTDQNPLVQYNTAGVFSVTLKAINVTADNSVTKTDYISVGTEGISYLTSTVSVYPNPTNGKLFITNPSKDSQEVIVYNALGKQINAAASARDIISLDFASQAKGMYLVKITNTVTKSVQVKKVVLR